ncbi:MAG: hypothetical protein IAI50_04625, partial [Candidatus Eremiobacteraeota bacterium]|nr:hypothetical protein [Candidatus Eremiobacteraeota bacterium]
DIGIAWVTLGFIVATAAFVWWELWGTHHPFIKMRLFENHNLRYGALLGFILGVPLFGAGVFLQYLQTGLHFTPSFAGGLLAVRIFAILLFVPFVAYSLGKRLIDPRFMIVTGFVLVGISYSMQFFATTTDSDFGTFITSVLISGAGFALLFSPIASTVLTSIPQEDFTRGVAIFKLTLTTGGAVASAALTAIVDRRNTYHLSALASGETLSSPTVASFLRTGSHAALDGLVAAQGTVLAYADTALYTAVLVFCVAPLAIVLRPPPRRRT